MYMCLCVPRNHRVREAVREKENAGREGESVHESKNELCKKKKKKKSRGLSAMQFYIQTCRSKRNVIRP